MEAVRPDIELIHALVALLKVSETRGCRMDVDRLVSACCTPMWIVPSEKK